MRSRLSSGFHFGLLGLALSAWAGAAAPTPAAPPADPQEPPGWLRLREGFAGWNSFHETPNTKTAEVWQFQSDGVLVCKGTPRGYLYTEGLYTDFVLELEWRYPAGATPSNGGVLARMTGDHGIWPRSLEFQLNLGQAGDFWGLRGYTYTGAQDRFKTLEHNTFGTLRHLKRQVDAEKPAGEWNRLEVVVEGGVATQSINGTRVNQAIGCEVVPGRILLTAEGQEIHFRNVRILPKR